MFNMLKNILNTPSIKPTINLPDGVVKKPEPIFLETRIRNYTHDEYNAFINELKTYSDGMLRIDISPDISRNAHNIVGVIYYSYNNKLYIDLSKESAKYYLNVCKNIRHLSGKATFDIYFNRDNLCIKVCSHIHYSYTEWFYKVTNFGNGSTFKSKECTYEFSTSIPLNTIDVNLSIYNEDELNKKLALIEPLKTSYIEYNYNNIKNEIESIVSQFPENFYIVSINDTKNVESMYTLTEPAQDITGSYRIDNVLFRDGYFVIIPAVMYRINVEKRSKNILTKKLIESCDSSVVRNKLNKYFGV